MDYQDEIINELKTYQYPIYIEHDIIIKERLFNELDKFQTLVTKHKKEIAVFNDIIKIISSIKKAYEFYYNGDFLEAYATISKILNIKVSGCKLNIDNYIEIVANDYNIFRSRTIEPHDKLDLKKMFHIPLNEKYKVVSNRFSAPGTPCLYLGGSSYICWLEAGKPVDNTFYVSTFRPNNELKILNLAIMAADLQRVKYKKEIFDKYLVTWPISMACSLKISNLNERNRNFKAEYIIPQLILQSLKKHNIDGVAYLSTYVDYNNLKNSKSYYSYLYTNYAFPAYNNETRLENKFKVSKPLNFAEIKNIKTDIFNERDRINYMQQLNIGINNPRICKSNRQESSIFISNSKFERSYGDTDFSLLEQELIEQELFEIQY